MNAALSVGLNKVSEPVKGSRGYYLIKVTKRTEFDKKTYETQSAILRNTMLQEKKSRYINQWISEIKQTADIVDDRHLFLGNKLK